MNEYQFSESMHDLQKKRDVLNSVLILIEPKVEALISSDYKLKISAIYEGLYICIPVADYDQLLDSLRSCIGKIIPQWEYWKMLISHCEDEILLEDSFVNIHSLGECEFKKAFASMEIMLINEVAEYLGLTEYAVYQYERTTRRIKGSRNAKIPKCIYRDVWRTTDIDECKKSMRR